MFRKKQLQTRGISEKVKVMSGSQYTADAHFLIDFKVKNVTTTSDLLCDYFGSCSKIAYHDDNRLEYYCRVCNFD